MYTSIYNGRARAFMSTYLHRPRTPPLAAPTSPRRVCRRNYGQCRGARTASGPRSALGSAPSPRRRRRRAEQMQQSNGGVTIHDVEVMVMVMVMLSVELISPVDCALFYNSPIDAQKLKNPAGQAIGSPRTTHLLITRPANAAAATARRAAAGRPPRSAARASRGAFPEGPIGETTRRRGPS